MDEILVERFVSRYRSEVEAVDVICVMRELGCERFDG